jgi:hypothetical protein
MEHFVLGSYMTSQFAGRQFMLGNDSVLDMASDYDLWSVDRTYISLFPFVWLNEMLQSLATPYFHCHKQQGARMVKNVLKRLYTHAQVPEHKMSSPVKR